MLKNVALGIPVTFTVLAVLLVALRFYARTRMKTGLGWDDWIMLLAVVSAPHIHKHTESSADVQISGDRDCQSMLDYNISGILIPSPSDASGCVRGCEVQLSLSTISNFGLSPFAALHHNPIDSLVWHS